MKHKNKLLGLLSLLAEQSGENVTPARLNFTAEKLAALDIEAVCAALERMLETARRFPTIAEIKQEMGGADALTNQKMAVLLAAKVTSAFRKYGSLQPDNRTGAKAIRDALGAEACHLVDALGGWNAALESYGHNESAFRAQIREVADAMLTSGAIAKTNVNLDRLPSHSDAISKSRQELLDSGEYFNPPNLLSGAEEKKLKLLDADDTTKAKMKDTLRKNRQAGVRRISLSEDYFSKKVMPAMEGAIVEISKRPAIRGDDEIPF